MSPTQTKSKKGLLRQRAEKLLSKKFTITPKIQDKDIKALVHELQVHQIELEMQNQELRKAQAEIEESRTKYSDLYDFSPVGYFTFSQAGEIVEVNLTGASLLGVDRGKLLHKPFSTFVDPEFRSLFRDHRLKVLKQGARQRCELKLVKKDGTPFHASLESISVPHGKSFRIRSVVSDITELKKAQEKAEIEHAFRISVENSILSGIAAVDLEGRLFYVNLGFCRMVGRSEKELLGSKPPFAFSPPEELDHINRVFQAMIDGKPPRGGVEIRFMRKNGERFDALVIPSQLKDHKGNAVGWIGTFGDMTHLKQVENELKELNVRLEERVRQRTAELETANQQLRQEIAERKEAEKESEHRRVEAENERHRLEAVMEALPVGVAITDAQGGNIRANRAFEQVWAGPRPPAASVRDYEVYKTWWTDTGKAVTPEEWASAQAVQKGQTVVGQRLEIQRFDGSRASVINSASPVFDAHGQIIGSAVAIVDITAHREAEMKYSKILATALSGFWITDLQGRLLEVNDALCQMLGYTHEELLALSIADVEAAESPAFVLNHIAALRQKKSDHFFSRHRRKDGSIIDVEVNSTWLEIGEGQLVGFMRDITERKRIDEALRRSRDELEIRVKQRTTELAKANELLERMFSSVDVSIAYMDKDFNFIRVNRAYAQADEREPEFYVGKNHFVLFPNDENKQIFRKVAETGEPYSVYAKPFEYAQNPERGVTYWDWSLQPVKEPDGNVGGVVLSMVNVTERKRAEEGIKRERQRFYDVLEMLPAYLVLLTPDYLVPFANRFFRERFGESHGKTCFEFLFGRSEPCEICESYTVLKTGAPHKWEWTGPDGRIYGVTDFPFTDTDGSTLILEMGIDITERKLAEEALRAAHQYTRSLIEASLDPLVTISPDGKVTDVNNATELATGISREQLIGNDFSDYFTETDKAMEGYQTAFLEGTVRDHSLAIRHRSGMITDVLYNATVYRNEAGQIQGVFAAARDVTKIKEIQKRMEATNALLSLFVKKLVRKEYLDSVIELIQPWTGCRCVGIRILNEKDYIPYEAYVGFSQEFWESENFLSVKYDQCACVRVVAGNPDPQDSPLMTPAGSFRCDNTFEFVGSLSDEEKARFRGVCVKNGFKSVAIVPIRYRDKIVGGIHLADENEGKVPMSRVQFIEFAAPLIGEAINRFNLEEELKVSETRLRALSSQLLTAQESERKRIAAELHDSVGQMLTAIKFKVENTLQEKGKGAAKAKEKSFEAIVPLVKETIEEVRRMQMDLHPSTLDDLGVLATLGWFSREYQKIYSHIRIDKEVAIEENEVPGPLKVVLYRLTQEAMNNIAKHSQADLVRLTLRKQESRIEWVIEDNGTGFDLEKILFSEGSKRGLGLSSMRERTELSGGKFMIESTLGKGTTLRASWPL